MFGADQIGNDDGCVKGQGPDGIMRKPCHAFGDKWGCVKMRHRREPVAIDRLRVRSANLVMFRRRYPKDVNYVVASDVSRTYRRSFDETEARFVELDGLIEALKTVRKDGTRAYGAR